MKNEYPVERMVLKAAAIVTFVLGISLLFFSAEIIKLFSKEWSQERHFAVYLGTALIGFAVANWLYSQSHELAAVRPAIIGNLVSLVAASIIDVIFLIRHTDGFVIWLILLLHAAFVCAFAYCLFHIRHLSKVTKV